MRGEKICHLNNKHLGITAEWRRWRDVDINTSTAAEIAGEKKKISQILKGRKEIEEENKSYSRLLLLDGMMMNAFCPKPVFEFYY